MIQDKNIEYLEKRIYLPSWQFQTYAIVGPSGGATDLGGAAGADAGAPVQTEISTFGYTGGQIGAAGDMFSHVGLIPADLDITKQMRFRVHWTTSSADADTPDWIVTYALFAEGETLTAATTALSTAIDLNDTATGALDLHMTGYGILNANTVGSDDEVWALRVECDDLGSATADELFFLGLEILYTPRKTAGYRNLRHGRRLSTPLGITLGTQVD